MNFRISSITILLLSLALCPLIFTKTLEEACELRLFPGKPQTNNEYIYNIGSLNAPFEGWAWANHATKTGYTERVIPFVRSIEASSCIHCALTVYSTDTHDGEMELYDLSNDSVLEFSFDVKSFHLDCEPVEFDFFNEEYEEETVAL